jgi:hypothetical protein
LYFAATSESAVYTVVLLSNTTAEVKILCDRNTVDIATGLPVGSLLTSPDNLAIDADGKIYVLEDQAPPNSDIWQAVDMNNDGVAEYLARWLANGVAGSEPTGLFFSPNTLNRAIVVAQHPSSGNDALFEINFGTASPPVTVPVTPPVTAPVRPPSKAPTDVPSQSPSFRPVKAPVKAPVLVPVPVPVTFPVKAPMAPTVISPMAPTVTSPMAPTVSSPLAPPASSPMTPPVTSPLASPVTSPRAPPVTVPVTQPVRVPVPVPVLAPVPVVVPVANATTAPTKAPVRPRCGLFGLSFFCPRMDRCGFFERLLGIGGC